MVEREHFTNGRCFIFGAGSALVGASFGAQIGGWTHWITVGIGYGVGIVLMLFATVLIAKSYFSRHPESPAEPPPSSGDSPVSPLRAGMDDRTSIEFRDQWAKTKHLQAYELGMEVSELFTPLQLEAFGIARDLRELALSKPRPVFDTRDYGAGEDGLFSAQEPGKLAVYMTAEATGIQQWRQEIRAKYVLSDLQKKATKLYHRFVDEAHLADRHLGCLVDTVDTDEALLDMAATIRKIAFQLEDAKP